MSDKGDAEQPCIKCGVVDQIKNMVWLSGFDKDDEVREDGDEYVAWVHEIPCYRDYRAIVMQLGLLNLQAYMEKLGKLPKERKP
jgi:hypothetical protein